MKSIELLAWFVLGSSLSAASSVPPALTARHASARGEELSQVYSAKLERASGDPQALDWESRPEDVWTLSKFEYEFDEQLELKLRNCTLVIGQSDGDAVWAVLLPEKKAKLKSTLGGEGETIDHIWMRFDPELIGELFPEKTVRGQGPKEARLEAYRIYQHKYPDSWAEMFDSTKDEGKGTRLAGYRIVLPEEGALTLDIDTDGDKRRTFSIDTRAHSIRYRHRNFTRPIPPAPSMDRKDTTEAFEAATRFADDLFASGLEVIGLDWEDHLKSYRKSITRGDSVLDVAKAVYGFLSPIDDSCLRLRFGNELVPAVTWQRKLNANLGGVQTILAGWDQTEGGIRHGTTPYGIAYMQLGNLRGEAFLTEFDNLLETFSDRWGLILDLRYGLRADADVVSQLAGRFVSEPTPYGVHAVWTNGVEENRELILQPRGDWTFDGVVYALTGPFTAGEAERLALMVESLPRGMTLGEPTAGHGVGAQWSELAPGLEIYRRAGLTIDTNGNFLPVEGKQPDKLIVVPQDEFGAKSDPVLYKALEEIYRVPPAERRKARSGELWVEATEASAPQR